MSDTCDRCEDAVEFYLYSAYDSGLDAIHPLVHRYPAAMWRACSRHVSVLLHSDTGGTPKWVVSRSRLPMMAQTYPQEPS